MSRGTPFKYVGIAIGGPNKGTRMGSPDPVYEVCRMERNRHWNPYRKDSLMYVETGRGLYEFDSGHWWWKGWGEER